MSKHIKLLKRMRENPKGDWCIDDLKAIADRYEITYRQPGTSHVTFRSSRAAKITVPSHKPIKSIYIKQFLAMLDELEVINE